MKVIHGRNVNEVFPIGIMSLAAAGVLQPSRAGDTLEFPTPVTTVYDRPRERVLFDPVRDANPFFHLHESLWMLGGRNDVASLQAFNKRMAEYSDDGQTFHGAYGHRWRCRFGLDQVHVLVDLLKEDPTTRRAVLQIWDAKLDLFKQGGGRMNRDLPCNVMAAFKIRDGRLNMIVYNRSNDMIWGAYGANVVHFSFLQEYMAGRIGVEVGTYRQVSDSLHAYIDVFDKVRSQHTVQACAYELGEVSPIRLMEHPDLFDKDLESYLADDGFMGYANPFFTWTADPMRRAWFAWKRRDLPNALRHADTIAASDWRKAALEWLQRRIR